MELCEKGELLLFLQNNKQPSFFFSIADICTVFRQIVLGVRYLHLNGILHRDLKLANILLNSKFIPKISDYGLSTIITRFKGGINKEGKICGTPNFLAPEILKNRKFSEKSDIWSLGCILYQMIMGKLPFSGDSIQETIHNIKTINPLSKNIPNHLAEDLMRRILIKDPDKRISMDQILEHPLLNANFNYASRINTFGLKPCKLTTSYGSFQILNDGNILMTILNESKIITIEGNGNSISIQDSKVLKYPYPPSSKKLKIIYEYAKSLINIIRRKHGMIHFIGADFEAFLLKKQKYTYFISFPSDQLNIAKSEQAENFLFFNNQTSLSKDLSAKIRNVNIYVCKAKKIYSILYSINSKFSPSNTQNSLLLYERVKPKEYMENFIDEFNDYQRIYIMNIGWCLFSSKGGCEFILIFDDGSTIFIDSECNKIGYLPNSKENNINWFSLDKPLPLQTKEKLKYLPFFANRVKFEK